MDTPAPVPPAPSPTLPLPLGATRPDGSPDSVATQVAAYGPGVPSPYAVAPAWAPPAPPHNVLAWVSFGLAIGGVLFGLLATIPAIVCGHLARRQIAERGEAGGPAALAGLIIGYALTALIVLGIGLYVLLLVFMITAAGASSGVGSGI
ncbi:DUF4190 domain-containing protein [Agromyces arachidis]|uniref:DUF4190 domain-containing protein n=1 Tax=Agromyces arachidis TaxID=766966 RepID=UPI0040565C7D